ARQSFGGIRRVDGLSSPRLREDRTNLPNKRRRIMIAQLVEDAGRHCARGRLMALGRASLAATVMALGVVTYVPPVMAALDLTGTWEGRWTCKDVTSGAETK